jgi:hypothetical protein
MTAAAAVKAPIGEADGSGWWTGTGKGTEGAQTVTHE